MKYSPEVSMSMQKSSPSVLSRILVVTITDMNKWIGITHLADGKYCVEVALQKLHNYWIDWSIIKFQSRYSFPIQNISRQQDQLKLQKMVGWSKNSVIAQENGWSYWLLSNSWATRTLQNCRPLVMISCSACLTSNTFISNQRLQYKSQYTYKPWCK